MYYAAINEYYRERFFGSTECTHDMKIVESAVSLNLFNIFFYSDHFSTWKEYCGYLHKLENKIWSRKFGSLYLTKRITKHQHSLFMHRFNQFLSVVSYSTDIHILSITESNRKLAQWDSLGYKKKTQWSTASVVHYNQHSLLAEVVQ